MDNTFTTHVEELIGMFEEDFLKAYRNIHENGKSRVLKHVPNLFKRWYFSALVEDTILTPANLMNSITANFHEPMMIPQVTVKGTMRMKNPFGYTLTEYSLTKHPAVHDFIVLLNCLQPVAELNDDDNLTDNFIDDMIGQMTVCESYYIDYLFHVAFELGLVKKIPSLHVNRAQVTPLYLEFLQLPAKEQLTRMVDAAVSFAARMIAEEVPFDIPRMSPSYLMELLRKPVTVDKIFMDLMDLESLDGYDLPGPQKENAEFDQFMLAGSFFLGVALDMFFLTPFGQFFGLIMPLYLLPIHFEEEFTSLLDKSEFREPLEMSLFSPCSLYTMTELGLAFFGQEHKGDAALPAGSANYAQALNFVLRSRMEAENSPASPADPENLGTSDQIYEIKVRMEGNPSYWKNIEISSSMTLHDFYCDICYSFGANVGGLGEDYSFFADEHRTPFSEYVSPDSRRRKKKADHTMLSELDLKENQKFSLAISNSFFESIGLLPKTRGKQSMRLELQLMRIKVRNSNAFYPRVSRQSKAFKEYYDMLELDF